MRPLPLLAALLVPLLALSACGRVGPVRPPGPREAIIYPRLYPYTPRTTAPAGGETGEATIEQGNLPVARPGSAR